LLQREEWKIYVQDVVQILAGPEKGATGKVLATIKDKQNPEVIVEGINMASSVSNCLS
jgi:ribosomal protein L24